MLKQITVRMNQLNEAQWSSIYSCSFDLIGDVGGTFLIEKEKKIKMLPNPRFVSADMMS